MVQVIETGNPQGKLSEMLGMSLGQGIGQGLNTFFATRSLESVMKDKSLEGAPQSKKLQAVFSAMAPYGELGKNLLEQYLQVAKQEESERFDSYLQKGFNKKNQKNNNNSFYSDSEDDDSEDEPIDPVTQGILAQKHPEFVSAYQAAQKERRASQEEQKERERKTIAGLDIAQKMKDKLDYTGATWIPGKSFLSNPEEGIAWNRNAVQQREYFDSLAAQIAGFFRELDTKGQLPQGLYDQVIKPRLPNSKLSKRENLGRIDGYIDLMKAYGGEKFTGKSKGSKSTSNAKKERFSFNNPNHKAKFDQQVSKFGMDQQKIREVLEKEFELD